MPEPRPPRPPPRIPAEEATGEVPAPGSPAAKDAAAFVGALSKAARAFVLYDPGNEIVRKFLADYHGLARKALDAHGALRLDVRAFEIALGGEPIYVEKDRERSLAFRLFRDGLRRLTFQPSVTWEELSRFLEILALLYVSVRQQEEDSVTLLRKSGFVAINFDAVEGFAPDEEDREKNIQRHEVSQAAPPPGWDEPCARLPQPSTIAFRAVPADALAALRAEEEALPLPAAALAAVREVLGEAARARWPFPNRDLVNFLAEVRDFLLSEGNLGMLVQLADLVVREAPDGKLREEILSGLGDARALEMLLRSVPEDAGELPKEIAPLSAFIALDPILDLLAAGQGPGRSRLLRALALARLPGDADALVARLPSLEASLAGDLLQALAARAPARAAEAALRLLATSHSRLQLEALRVLEAAEGEVPTAPFLPLLAAADEKLRIRTVELLGKKGEPSAFEPLARSLQDRGKVPPEEAAALGRALALIAPIPAARLLAEWVKPRKGFFKRLLPPSPRERALQWAAVAGLGALPGGDVQARIEQVAKRGDPALRRHCAEVLARRRNERARHG